MDSRPLKEFARCCGADLVGAAPMERFERAPPAMDPRCIFPGAKAVVVFGFRIPRGCFRGIEEGTYFAAYPSLGYSHINLVCAPTVLRKVSLYLEDQGYEVVPVQNMTIMGGGQHPPWDADRAAGDEVGVAAAQGECRRSLLDGRKVDRLEYHDVAAFLL